MTTPLNPADYDALACADSYSFRISSPRDTYLLDVLADTCTCPDCVFNRKRCKHLRELESIAAANIERKERRAQETYPAHAAQLLTEARALRVNLAACRRLYVPCGVTTGQRLAVAA